MPSSLRWLALALPIVLACGDDGGDPTGSGSNTSGGASVGGGGGGHASGGGAAGGGDHASGGGGAAGGADATGGGPTGGGGDASGGGGATGGGGVGFTCDDATGTLPALTLTPVADGLVQPVFVTAPAGDYEHLFVVEQRGVIRVVENGVLLDTPFVDLQDQVNDLLETGLLGLTFHPDYATNGRFFVFGLKQDNTANQVFEFARVTDVTADPTLVRNFVPTGPGAGSHAGGSLFFEPGTTHLVVTLGEVGGPMYAPDLEDPRGKLLRYDVDMYSDTEPVAGNVAEGFPHVWQFGFRNPYRGSVDPCTGVAYIGDVGPAPAAFEEINVVQPGQVPSDYGWDETLCTGPGCGDGDAYPDVDPVVAYDHADGNCAVIGGYVYRGSAIPALRGRYLYADYCSRQVRSFVLEGGAATDPLDLTDALGSEALELVSSMGQDGAGNLYLVDYGPTAGGAVYRIDVAP